MLACTYVLYRCCVLGWSQVFYLSQVFYPVGYLPTGQYEVVLLPFVQLVVFYLSQVSVYLV